MAGYLKNIDELYQNNSINSKINLPLDCKFGSFIYKIQFFIQNI